MFSPSALELGGGGFGDVDGLLQSSAQVDGPLLDDLPDVFDPVLFVLDTRSLREQRQSVRVTWWSTVVTLHCGKTAPPGETVQLYVFFLTFNETEEICLELCSMLSTEATYSLKQTKLSA